MMRAPETLCTLRTVLAASVLALAGMQTAAAQDKVADAYPTKPVRLIIPYAAGGPTDVVARTVTQKLTEKWGQPFLLDNRAGADGLIGMSAAAQAPADGYTLLLGGTGVVTSNPALYAKLPYDSQKDYAPIVLASAGAFLLLTHPKSGITSVADLIRMAKAKPGELMFGSGGGQANLAGLLLQSVAGIQTTMVSYKGAAPSMTDLMGGQISYIFTSTTAALPSVQAGKLVALGVTSRKRATSMPDVPTVAETLPAYDDVVVWYGFLAPAQTPPGIVTKLNREINTALQSKDVVQRLAGLGGEVVGGTPEYFAKVIGQEIMMWKRLVKEANISLINP